MDSPTSPHPTQWEAHREWVDVDRVRKLWLTRDEAQLGFAEVLQLWRDDPTFCAFFVTLLAEAPFSAFYWETPPLAESNSERPFEFVLADSRPLAGVSAEPHAFAQHFRRASAEDQVVAFPNLGADAHLIVPLPRAEQRAYPHLAAFSRHAPLAQQHALWQTVGATMLERLGNAPIWLSTAGTGVFWVHVRLDSRPKYVTFAPYRAW